MMSYRLSLLIFTVMFSCLAFACGVGACSSPGDDVVEAPDTPLDDDGSATADDVLVAVDATLDDILPTDTVDPVDVGNEGSAVPDVVEGSGSDEPDGDADGDIGAEGSAPTDGSAGADAGDQVRQCALACVG